MDTKVFYHEFFNCLQYKPVVLPDMFVVHRQHVDGVETLKTVYSINDFKKSKIQRQRNLLLKIQTHWVEAYYFKLSSLNVNRLIDKKLSSLAEIVKRESIHPAENHKVQTVKENDRRNQFDTKFILLAIYSFFLIFDVTSITSAGARSTLKNYNALHRLKIGPIPMFTVINLMGLIWTATQVIDNNQTFETHYTLSKLGKLNS